MPHWIHTRCRFGLILVVWLGGFWPSAEAGAAGLRLHLHRSPDVPFERLDRPLRASDRPPQKHTQAILTQATVITLAKAALKEELGKAFRDYEVKSVLFDAGKNEWSVLFNPTASPKPAVECVTVFVDDETRETMLLRCR